MLIFFVSEDKVSHAGISARSRTNRATHAAIGDSVFHEKNNFRLICAVEQREKSKPWNAFASDPSCSLLLVILIYGSPARP